MMPKYMNAMAPWYLPGLFCKRATNHDGNTPNKHFLHFALCKTKSGQRSFQYRAGSIIGTIWMTNSNEWTYIVTYKIVEKGQEA